MTPAELLDVIARYPFLRAGLPDHAAEVLRLAKRILVEEATPIARPDLPAGMPPWEHAFWARRAERRPA
jgi:hypothetical protein